jgi:large conductance mechanosensitive channel
MLKEFRDFINRGNVVDLAVAVVLGAAFGLVVTAFTEGVLMQLVSVIVGEPDFNALTIDISDTPIYYGRFLTALVNFILIAFAVFLVVKAINRMQNLRKTEELEEAQITEVELLAEIRDLLRTRA